MDISWSGTGCQQNWRMSESRLHGRRAILPGGIPARHRQGCRKAHHAGRENEQAGDIPHLDGNQDSADRTDQLALHAAREEANPASVLVLRSEERHDYLLA
ncbi:hypothetical protein [Afipia sp. DC4300-2b1]|uniref:hypothetical protein n=1 Tax=Afipia sp. DC4300-2b1 TaxID=2804672 RepID=UPI003CF4E444